MVCPDTKETEQISQLRAKVCDLQLKEKFNTDRYLIRWIRGLAHKRNTKMNTRQHNLNLAEKMLREHFKWREENDIDNILSWTPPESVVKLCPATFLGYDQNNSPVQLLQYGKWDLKKIVEIGEGSNFIKYTDQLGEFLLDKMEGKFTPMGLPVTQFVCILDMRGLAYRTLASLGALDLILQLARRFEANFPETVQTVFEINCNAVFAALYAISKPIASQATLDKLQIFSSDESKWKPALLARVPAAILPPSLGGTALELGEIELSPTSAKDESDEEETPFLEVNVPAGDKLDICFSVEEGNSSISWAFKTKKYDISFAVNCDGKAYIEKTRVDSHEKLQEGSIICDTPGDYIFTFDNTYSRIRVKVLTYKIDVKTPSGHKHIGLF